MRSFLNLLSTLLWILVTATAVLAQDEGAKSATVPNSMGVHTWFIIIAMGALLTWCISYSIQVQKEALARSKGRGDLVRRKDEILDQIAALEGRKDAGEIAEPKYRKELKELKGRLSRVIEQLGRALMDANTPALESENIRKTFGYFTALAGVNLSIKRGEFVTLFGRNGAGKTTFLKVAATLIRPTQGKLRIQGIDIAERSEEARRHIGFLSHNTFLYRDLNPVENLHFFSRLYGMANAEQRIQELIERVGLKRRMRDPVRTFSRGLQQRLGIARVLLHSPSVILLDEPYTGLDANAVAMLNDILDEAVRAGNTVMLTTHDIEQGLRAANRAIIIDKGAVVFSGDPRGQAVREAYAQYIQAGANG